MHFDQTEPIQCPKEPFKHTTPFSTNTFQTSSTRSASKPSLLCVCVCVTQVATKTVAQCVEFYYTYKKHVKIGRNGTLLFGETEPTESRVAEDEAEQKVSGRSRSV